MHRTRRLLATAILAASGAVLWQPALHGYRLLQATSTGRLPSLNEVSCGASGGFLHWNIRDIDWYLNTSGQGSGKASAIQAAATSWTNVFHSGYAPTYAGTTTAGFSTDGINTILWANGNGCTGTCGALTALVVQSGQLIVESDITFNSTVTWNTDGSDVDTQAVATHELGHSLGIAHTNLTSTPRPTMYYLYFGVEERSLHPDDGDALECSECRYCSEPRYSQLSGDGTTFASQKWAWLSWCSSCQSTGNVDVFRDGTKIATTSNSGGYTDRFTSSATSANYWVCEAGSTSWYDSDTCSNVVTVYFTF